MKPDGTHTKEEFLELITNELQSWERDEICAALLKDCSDNQLSDFFSRYTPEYISTITGYYVYKEKREDIYEISLNDFMHESDYGTYDLFEYIESNVPDYKIADWISASKELDKTVLLDKLDRDILIKYFNSNFDIKTEIKITPRKED